MGHISFLSASTSFTCWEKNKFKKIPNLCQMLVTTLAKNYMSKPREETSGKSSLKMWRSSNLLFGNDDKK